MLFLCLNKNQTLTVPSLNSTYTSILTLYNIITMNPWHQRTVTSPVRSTCLLAFLQSDFQFHFSKHYWHSPQHLIGSAQCNIVPPSFPTNSNWLTYLSKSLSIIAYNLNSHVLYMCTSLWSKWISCFSGQNNNFTVYIKMHILEMLKCVKSSVFLPAHIQSLQKAFTSLLSACFPAFEFYIETGKIAIFSTHLNILTTIFSSLNPAEVDGGGKHMILDH